MDSLVGIEYHDYVMMIAALDTEWTRGVPKEQTGLYAGEPQAQCGEYFFDKSCKDYKASVHRNQQAWAKRVGLADPSPIPSWFFSSQEWVPCGHSDALCLALSDDFDAVQTIIETYPKTVEELSVAFCPRMSSLLGESEVEFRQIFLEPHEWLDEGFIKQRECCPLLHFARLKLQGVVTLGRALPMLGAAYRVFVRRILEGMKILHANASSQDAIVSKADLANLKVCFLDLQEEEEIGILFFTSNLSLPMSLLSHLQSLTYGNLLADYPQLKQHIEKTNHFEQLLAFAKKAKVLEPQSGDATLECLADSHILRWTRSTVAFSSRLRSEGAAWDHVRGFCRPSIAVNHPPGHQNNLESMLHQAIGQVRLEHPDRPAAPKIDSYREHVAGTTDYFLPLIDHYLEESRPALVPTAHVIRGWMSVEKTVSEQFQNNGRSAGRHLSGWTATLAIPVPKVDYGNQCDVFHPLVPESHCALLKLVLEHIKKHVFPVAKNEDPQADHSELYSSTGEPKWSFCLDELRMKTRMVGIPVETRRSLILLYENFASILSNPLLFDIVLDFYDVLATLYVMLVDLGPNRSTVAHPEDYTPRMNAAKVDGLNAIIESIDVALELRQRRLYPESRFRDWALDIRSNILQMTLSAEAALKCSVGIVRKFVYKNEDLMANLGVVHQVGFSAGIDVPQNAFGRETNSLRLRQVAQFRSGVAHLTSLSGFADFFHESFHLAADRIVKGNLISRLNTQLAKPILSNGLGESGVESSLEPLKQLVMVRHEELFVQLCMILYVYHGDWELALKCHAMDYSSSVRSAHHSPEDARDEFALQFSPILLACLVVQTAKTEGNIRNRPWQTVDLTPEHWPTLEQMAGFVEQCMNLIRPYLADYAWMMAADPSMRAMNSVKRAFQLAYLGVHPNLEALWMPAALMFSRYMSYVVEKVETSSASMAESAALASDDFAEDETIRKFESVCKVVDNRIDSGLGKAAYTPPLGIFFSEEPLCKMPDGSAIDAALLACRTLLMHITRTYPTAAEESDTTIFLRRSPTDGRIDWDGGLVPGDILLDRTATAAFSCTSEYRRRRTGMRIMMFKTFWDIASRNRGRRLRSLMSQALACEERVQCDPR